MRLVKNLTLCLLAFFLFSSLIATAESSQFSLLADEFNLPLDGVSVSGTPEALDNVPLDKLPQALKHCFDNNGKRLLLLNTDESGKPFMNEEEMEGLTFTGPYYQIFLSEILESPDLDQFRESFSENSSLKYLIRLDGRPASVFTVTYDPYLEIYEFYSLSDHIGAQNMANNLDSLSDSSQYTDDVLFLQIGFEEYIMNADDQVVNSFLMEHPVAIPDIAKALYTLQQEAEERKKNNGGVISYGGSSLVQYITRSTPATGDNLTPWIIIGASTIAALVCLALLLGRKRKII